MIRWTGDDVTWTQYPLWHVLFVREVQDLLYSFVSSNSTDDAISTILVSSNVTDEDVNRLREQLTPFFPANYRWDNCNGNIVDTNDLSLSSGSIRIFPLEIRLIHNSTQRCVGGGLGQRAGGDVEHLDLPRLLRAGEVRARRLGGASQQEGARALGDQPAVGRVGECQR